MQNISPIAAAPVVPPDNRSLYQTTADYHAMMAFYDATLAKLPIPYQTHYLETRFGTTHVLTAGREDAPPLVLWHGMNGSLVMWAAQIPTFAAHYRVIAPDIPGHSGRSTPRRLNRKSLEYGEWAAETLQQLGVSQAYHVGISGGGWMILKLAAVAPQTIKRAVLLSSGGFTGLSPRLIFKMLPHLLLPTGRSNPEAMARRFLKVMSPPDHVPPEDEVKTFTLIMRFKSEQSIPPLPDNELRCLTAPTMLLMGEYEAAFHAPSVVKRARQLLPNLVHAEIVRGVGHGMIGEQPALINQKILDFLAQV